MMFQIIKKLASCVAIMGCSFGFWGDAIAQEKKAAPGSFLLPQSRSASEIISLFDQDKDNRISNVERRVRIIRVFGEFDKDRSNSLSKSELPNVTAEEFFQGDTNKDGAISAMEFSEADFTNFSALDTNRDGFISADELEVYVIK